MSYAYPPLFFLSTFNFLAENATFAQPAQPPLKKSEGLNSEGLGHSLTDFSPRLAPAHHSSNITFIHSKYSLNTPSLLILSLLTVILLDPID